MTIDMTPRDNLERLRMHDAWADGFEGVIREDNPYQMPTTFAGLHITGVGFRTLGVYRAFFTAELARQRKIVADYESEVADWYENGDGAAPDWRTDARCSECFAYFPAGENGSLDPCPESEAGVHVLDFTTVNYGGLNHTFPHCIHGSSRWTDYDNICGGCEDGRTPIELAQCYAREAFLRFNDRWDWVSSAPGDLDEDVRRDLTKWALAPSPFGK